jgi:hypothetical protein
MKYGKHGRNESIKTLVGRPEGKRTLGRPSRKWEVNVKMDLIKNMVLRCGLDSPSLGQSPVTSSCEYCNIPPDSIIGGEFLTSLATISFSMELFRSYNY